MEDVIEELLQEEIYDEADVSRSNMGRRLQLAKAKMILNKKYVNTVISIKISNVILKIFFQSATPIEPAAIGAPEVPVDFLRKQSVKRQISAPVLESSKNGPLKLSNGDRISGIKISPSGGFVNTVYEE